MTDDRSERRSRPLVVHLTTTDISLDLLLGPQLRAMIDAGYEVVGASAPGPHVASIEALGVRHIALSHLTRAMAPGEDFRALIEIGSLLRRLRPDIVHTHNPKPGVFGRLVAGACRVPAVVNTVHGLYALPTDPAAKRAIVYGLERLAATCSDAELVQSADDVAVLRRLGVPRDRVHHLGNGIDLARFDRSRLDQARVVAVREDLGLRRDDVLCGTIGRLVWEKGFREIFAAARHLRTRFPGLRFVVAGPSDLAKNDSVPPEELDRAAQEYGVIFRGYRSDVEHLYAAMDMFVLASYREGFSRSGMEAAAMGLPVVTVDGRGCRDVVDDGVSGIVVPPRDASALADAIAGLAVDPLRRASMGRAGIEKARRDFDQQRVIETTLRVYERLLQRASGGESGGSGSTGRSGDRVGRHRSGVRRLAARQGVDRRGRGGGAGGRGGRTDLGWRRR